MIFLNMKEIIWKINDPGDSSRNLFGMVKTLTRDLLERLVTVTSNDRVSKGYGLNHLLGCPRKLGSMVRINGL